MASRPTIADLAKTAGVSVATVDRVLNRRLPVRGPTAERVVKAAEEIGYHATGLLRRRLTEVPLRRLGFLLQRRNNAFYDAFAAELVRATRAAVQIEGKPIVEFADELEPATIARRLSAMAEKSDALAVVAVDHPLVIEAVEAIMARGKPVFTLLSDISTPKRASYLAVDSRKAGRTAAWVIARTAQRPGKIGILVGSHRYLSHELSEISFRSFMREHVQHLTLLESAVNLDDDGLAYEAVSRMIKANPDLAGIYAAGGGQDGVIGAVRDHRAGGRIAVVCNELTPATKAALIDGTIDLAIATPITAISEKLVSFMSLPEAQRVTDIPAQVLFSADLFISENI